MDLNAVNHGEPWRNDERTKGEQGHILRLAETKSIHLADILPAGKQAQWICNELNHFDFRTERGGSIESGNRTRYHVGRYSSVGLSRERGDRVQEETQERP